MWSQKVYDDTEPDVWNWSYKCMPCVKRDENFSTDQEAWSWIYEKNGTATLKRAQVDKFKQTMGNIKETYDCIGAKKEKREIYQLSRTFMQALFAEFAEFIVLKARQMQAMVVEDDECKQMVEELKTEKDPMRIRVLVEEIEKHIGSSIPQLSFDGRNEMLYAAAYTDEWVCIASGHFRHYFICLAGSTTAPCLHMITSKAWEQLFPGEAWHAGQRWYCRDTPWNQEHRYYAKYGVIVEIRRGNTIYYMRAEVPDKQKLDILAMSYEKKYGKDITPAELYAKIPIVRPSVTELVTPYKAEKGIYKFRSVADLALVPWWSWDEIYTFSSKPLP